MRNLYLIFTPWLIVQLVGAFDLSLRSPTVGQGSRPHSGLSMPFSPPAFSASRDSDEHVPWDIGQRVAHQPTSPCHGGPNLGRNGARGKVWKPRHHQSRRFRQRSQKLNDQEASVCTLPRILHILAIIRQDATESEIGIPFFFSRTA